MVLAVVSRCTDSITFLSWCDHRVMSDHNAPTTRADGEQRPGPCRGAQLPEFGLAQETSTTTAVRAHWPGQCADGRGPDSEMQSAPNKTAVGQQREREPSSRGGASRHSCGLCPRDRRASLVRLLYLSPSSIPASSGTSSARHSSYPLFTVSHPHSTPLRPPSAARHSFVFQISITMQSLLFNALALAASANALRESHFLSGIVRQPVANKSSFVPQTWTCPQPTSELRRQQCRLVQD